MDRGWSPLMEIEFGIVWVLGWLYKLFFDGLAVDGKSNFGYIKTLKLNF